MKNQRLDSQAGVWVQGAHLGIPAVVVDGVPLRHPQHWTLTGQTQRETKRERQREKQREMEMEREGGGKCIGQGHEAEQTFTGLIILYTKGTVKTCKNPLFKCLKYSQIRHPAIECSAPYFSEKHGSKTLNIYIIIL